MTLFLENQLVLARGTLLILLSSPCLSLPSSVPQDCTEGERWKKKKGHVIGVILCLCRCVWASVQCISCVRDGSFTFLRRSVNVSAAAIMFSSYACICVFIYPCMHTSTVLVCLNNDCVSRLRVFFDPLRAWWDGSYCICQYCILYFERSLGRWRCREGQACCSLWASLHSMHHVYSSFYKSTKTTLLLRLRWHTGGAVSALCSVVETGLQGEGSEQWMWALWGLFSFRARLSAGFAVFSIILRHQWLLCDCSVMAELNLFVQL